MKKLICVFLTVITALSALSLTALADEEESKKEPEHENVSSLLVFGDSIPAGYALDGYSKQDPFAAEDCFINLLCAEYGLKPGSTCKNYSRSGLPTDKILEKIKATDKDTVKNADIILISAGANDIMDIVEQTVLSEFGKETEYFESRGIRIDSSDLVSYEKSIISVITNPDTKDGMERIYTACTDDKAKRTYTDTVLKAENNVKEMISYIRETGSNAEIVFLVPYNPTEIIKNNPLIDTIKELLFSYRDKLTALCESSEYGYSANALDLLGEFEGKALELTNISSLDIHPNKKGHQKIAELSSSLIDTVLAEKNKQESIKEARSAPYSDTVVYIIFGVACTLVILIMIIGVIKYRKKEL